MLPCSREPVGPGQSVRKGPRFTLSPECEKHVFHHLATVALVFPSLGFAFKALPGCVIFHLEFTESAL